MPWVFVFTSAGHRCGYVALKPEEHLKITEHKKPDDTCAIISKQQIDAIMELLEGVALTEERFSKALENYGVSYIEDLSLSQADDFIINLRKIYAKQSNVSGACGEG